MNFNPFIITVSVIILLFSFIFLVFLFVQTKKTFKTNSLVGLVAISFLWLLLDFLRSIPLPESWMILLVWKLGFIASFAISGASLRFVCRQITNTPCKFLYFILIPLLTIFTAVTLVGDKIIKGVKPLEFFGQANFIPGDWFLFALIMISSILLIATFVSFRHFFLLEKGDEKKSFLLISLGLLFPLILAPFTNMILPFLGFSVPKLANVAIFFGMVFFILSIYKFSSFDISLRHLKIKNKISFTFLLTYIVIITVIGFVMRNLTIRVMTEEIFGHLETISEIEKNKIIDFLEEQKNKIEIVAAHQELSNEELKDIGVKSKTFYELFVLDAQGKIIASSDESNIGLDKSQNEYFVKALESTYIKDVYFSETTQKNILTVSAPHTGGVLVGRIDLAVLQKVISDPTGLGKTGEVLLAKRDENGDAVFFTERKYHMEDTVESKISKENLNDPITQALLKKESIFSGVTDYHGESALAATRYIEEMDWGLIVKIHEEEAFAPTNEIVYFFIFFACIALLIYLFISLWISGKISKPIEKLREDVEIIEGGDLNHQINITSRDEVGGLSRAFNDMTSAIKKSRLEINEKVKEQTEEIKAKGEEMENQQKAILNILEDVEDEKKKVEKLAEDLKKFELAVENASDHIVITNPEGIVIYANKGVEGITGFEKEEIMGKKAGTKENWGGLMDNKFYEEMWNTIKNKKQIFEGDIKNKRKNGEEYDVAASLSPILNKDGEVVFFVGIERDITKEKQIDRAKTEFVSLASHQLRTPLSTIGWYSEMLLNGDVGHMKPEQANYVEEIYRGNKRMVDLVNSLLNVSRIELGTFIVEPKKQDITKIADIAIEELMHKIDERKIKFTKTYDKGIAEMNLDEKLTLIIFQNLLSNAVKYTPEKGKVNLEIKKKTKELEIVVSDSGLGIPKTQQDKIFTKLFRADNVRETDTEGTGLGLYLVKSIVDHSGGKVWFESQQNKGTTFHVTIPLTGMKKKEGQKALS